MEAAIDEPLYMLAYSKSWMKLKWIVQKNGESIPRLISR
jgi:hypothetical protein